MAERPFIDMLHIHEKGAGRAPLNGGMVVSTDRYGEVEWSSQKFMPEQGSYDTRLNIRVDREGRLEIRGNPTRFDREDNLFGIGIAESRTVINQVLQRFDQAPLGPKAYVSRMDVTKNYRFETIAKMRAYIALLQNQKKGTYRKGDMIAFGSAKYLRTVVYPKGPEIRHHQNKKRESHYRARLARYCDDNAVLRVEMRFGHDYWYRNREDSYVNEIADTQVHAMFDERVDAIVKEIETEKYDDLSMNEIGVLLAWAKGLRPKERIKSMTTYYKYRRRILDVTGHDIGSDNNVYELPKKPMTITISELQPPEWYRFHPLDPRANETSD